MKSTIADMEKPERTGHGPSTQENHSQPPDGHDAPRARSKGFNLRTFSSLRYRDYRILWTSIVFMSAGQWMQQIALSWMAYQMTDSPFMLGAINGFRAIPFLLFGPWAGVAADRIDRKKLMLLSQAYVMILSFGLAVLIFSGLIQVWHLFVYTFMSGLGWSVTQPVRQALLPNLVPKDELQNAVALQSAGFNSTRVLGPTAAGLLIAWVGPGGAFLAQSVAYLVILALVWTMRVPAIQSPLKRQSAGADLVDGFRYIKGNQIVFSLILLALIPMLFAMPFQTLIPVFARDVLNMGPKGYGLLVSFAGIGALTGTLIVASLGGFRHKGLLLLGSAAALGAFLFLFSQSTLLPLSLFLMVFVGGFQMTYMSLNNTLLHMNITDDMRGRVMSIYMLDQGLTPLGSLFAGTTASVFGAPVAVAVMGASCILLALTAAAHTPIIRRLP